MELIKQLGGYDLAKNTYEKLKTEMTDKQRDNKTFMNAFDGLSDELLQYRRENNIFEESDKIVFVDDFMHGELMTVAWTRKGEVWMDDGAKRCTDLSMIRHATPEEIQAGHRLD